MNYKLEISAKLQKIFNILKKKDSLQSKILKKKIIEILENPHRFKSLTSNMTGIKRVHIKHFVLTYEILEKERIVKLLDYSHHDKIYK